jgi:hypothetical protein
MRGPVEDDLVAAGADVNPQGDLVAHRAAGQEQRGLVSEEVGNPFLEAARGRIQPALLIPHLRGGDRRPHAIRGTGLRVAVEVDGPQRSAA